MRFEEKAVVYAQGWSQADGLMSGMNGSQGPRLVSPYAFLRVVVWYGPKLPQWWCGSRRVVTIVVLVGRCCGGLSDHTRGRDRGDSALLAFSLAALLCLRDLLDSSATLILFGGVRLSVGW